MKTLFHENLKPDDSRPPKGGWAPGDYCGMRCRICSATFTGDKRAFECADCAYEKQEFYHPPSVDRLEQTKITKCPYCGDTDFGFALQVPGKAKNVYCQSCGMQGPLRPTQSDAIRAWNSIPRRSEVRELLKKIEQVESSTDELGKSLLFMSLCTYADKLRKKWGI